MVQHAEHPGWEEARPPVRSVRGREKPAQLDPAYAPDRARKPVRGRFRYHLCLWAAAATEGICRGKVALG